MSGGSEKSRGPEFEGSKDRGAMAWEYGRGNNGGKAATCASM